ncbi:hypothetical protein CFR71_04580 [Novacetimonas pomaceti]|uniref:Uncharacterized protein n=1 Tax=Novacetimonas pomaceti TaxID=2021998 RepID=A0A318QFL8_9PROT|nr:hypothetical protein CFR71_04580 [Novacetimonas pomaceti]
MGMPSFQGMLTKYRDIIRKFLVKLFSKSFERRRLFEKRRHPKTFITVAGRLFQTVLRMTPDSISVASVRENPCHPVFDRIATADGRINQPVDHEGR